MSIAHEEFFDRLFEGFKNAVSNIECNAENFMDFLVKAMELVERFANDVKKDMELHGLEKKELVEDILCKFFAELTDWAQEREEDYNKLMIELTIYMDKIIDILVSAAKGYLHFNEYLVQAKCCKPKSRRRKNKNETTPKDISEVTPLVDQVYDDVRKSIVNKTFSATNFIVLVTIVMQVVEKLAELSGPEKKEIAIRVIKRLIMEIPMPENEKEAIAIIVETTLSKSIDYIIMAANGELDFGKIKEQFKSIFGCCTKAEN
jgi:hypothetical protein